MNSIGLDFGTTYSVIAALGQDLTLNAAMLNDEDCSPFYDSLVVRRADGTLSFGRLARTEIWQPGSTVYKGFKLMLAEEDPRLLKERGYDSSTTPEDVVRGYLADLLKRYQKRYGEIDRLVIGVPEIWVENSVKQRCYERLYDLAAGMGLAREVVLLSEPTCACAYYVEKFKEKNGGAIFQGNVLIVDYGGGTLDIALCQVENERGTPKVTVLHRSGAGANEEGVLGKAGFAFMEEIVRLALAAGGLSPEEINCEENKGALYECVYTLEEVFKSLNLTDSGRDKRKRLQEIQFSLARVYQDQTEFALLSFRRQKELDGSLYQILEQVTVTYGMVARAFQEKIAPVLNSRLDDMIRYMREHQIAYGLGEDHFKIQLIGGFCNFCWVQYGVRKKLGLSALEDRRYIGELSNADERTMAVACGAALLANEQTRYGFVSQYSIGLPAKYQTAARTLWAIRRDMELTTGHIYLFKSSERHAAIIGADGIEELIYQGDCGPESVALDPQYAGMLRMNTENMSGYIMGISQDRSKIITFHWWEVTQLGKIARQLDRLEERLAQGEQVEGLGPEHRERLNKALRLGNAAPAR